VPSNAPLTILRQQASSSEVARQWLVRFGEICQREVTPVLAQIWEEQLRDITPELLERACDRIAKTWTSGFLPTPGNIRAAIDQANAKAFELKTEQAWQFALNFCMRCYHPDMGVSRRAPELPAAINHAIKAAGGMNFIYNCSGAELVWAKKRFIEDYTTIHETDQVEHLLTDGEARKLLRRIAAGPQSDSRLIAQGRAAEPTPECAPGKLQPTDAEVNQATETARRKIFGAPIREMTDVEIAEEVRRQKAALIERGWLKESKA
jgi:hypothetical protein